jgi:hypothetical protein
MFDYKLVVGYQTSRGSKPHACSQLCAFFYWRGIVSQNVDEKGL